MQRAYNVANSGSIIEIRGRQLRRPDGARAATRPSRSAAWPGNKIRQLKSDADNITYDGLDLDAGGTKTTGAVFEHGGAFNVTLKNSRVGNVIDEKGAMLGGSSSTSPTNLVIDNVDFHDVIAQTSGVHNECIMAHAPGITIRNSTFRNCATMDISLGRGDWWGQPPYGNVVLENNVFGHSINGSGWHYYGLAWFVGKFENARVVNNTFENAVRMEDQHVGSGPYSGVWANNIGGGWACLTGVTYRNNVGKSLPQLRQGRQPDRHVRAAGLPLDADDAGRLGQPGSLRLPPDRQLGGRRRRNRGIRSGQGQGREDADRDPGRGRLRALTSPYG